MTHLTRGSAVPGTRRARRWVSSKSQSASGGRRTGRARFGSLSPPLAVAAKVRGGDVNQQSECYRLPWHADHREEVGAHMVACEGFGHDLRQHEAGRGRHRRIAGRCSSSQGKPVASAPLATCGTGRRPIRRPSPPTGWWTLPDPRELGPPRPRRGVIDQVPRERAAGSPHCRCASRAKVSTGTIEGSRGATPSAVASPAHRRVTTPWERRAADSRSADSCAPPRSSTPMTRAMVSGHWPAGGRRRHPRTRRVGFPAFSGDYPREISPRSPW